MFCHWASSFVSLTIDPAFPLSIRPFPLLPSRQPCRLFFLFAVTKGFVYSSFLKPYNARRSHSDASVGSHSSAESELGRSSPGLPRQNSSSTLTFNPSSMAVSFTSGPCRKQPQDASSWKELAQGPPSTSLNVGGLESGPCRCPSDPLSAALPRPWDAAEAARDGEGPAPAPRSYRTPRHPEMAGCPAPGRNGQGKDLVRGCARTAPPLGDRSDEPGRSEAEGNQVGAPCSPCGRAGVWPLRAALPGLGEAGCLGPGRPGRGLPGVRAGAETRCCLGESLGTSRAPSAAGPPGWSPLCCALRGVCGVLG